MSSCPECTNADCELWHFYRREMEREREVESFIRGLCRSQLAEPIKVQDFNYHA